MDKQHESDRIPLPLVAVPASGGVADDIVSLASLQEAAGGGFQHLDAAGDLAGLDPTAAQRLHGKPDPRVHIESYGCQMNDHDTEIMYGILDALGYRRAADVQEADVLLFNTCAVRESAVEHALGRIGQLKPLKYTRSGLVVGVCGCVPQVKGQVERLLRLFPHLDLIFGTHNIRQLPQLIERARSERETVVDIWDAMGETLPERLPVARQGSLKAWVTIVYGCNKNCTYCIVPQTRGRERSRLPQDVLSEVQDLGAAGFKEVTLLGQNVNAYGRDLGYTDFGDLLTLLDQNTPGVERIRFTTNHPKDFTPKMVDAIAAAAKVCRWFHLPVQSGCDAVLRRMKRSYNRRQYLDLVRQVRMAMPDAVITTDIIVGFPGETDAQFLETLSLMTEVRYDAAFLFMYSPRAGTESERYPDQLPIAVKKERLQRLIDLQNRISLEVNQTLVGSAQEVLVEDFDKGKPNLVFGRTRGNKLVTLPGDGDLIGQTVTARILAAHPYTLEGLPVSP